MANLISNIISSVNNLNYTSLVLDNSSSPYIALSGITSIYSTSGEALRPNERIILDPKPLSHFLKKEFPFVLDVTSINYEGGVRMYNPNTFDVVDSKNSVLEIVIVVSPTHYSELTNNVIERKIKNKMNELLEPLLKCMYSEYYKREPRILFFPDKSETILEFVK